MEQIQFSSTQSEYEHETSVLELLKNNTKSSLPVGLLKDTVADAHIIPPHIIKTWIELDIQVYIQRNYGAEMGYTNMEYAEIGAEIIDTSENIIKICPILVKYSFPCEDDFFLMNKGKILISQIDSNLLTLRWAQHCYQNQITAFGLNLLQSDTDNWTLRKYFILKDTETRIDYNAVISHAVNILAHCITLQSCVSTTPLLLQTIYCFQGQICRSEIAEKAEVPWKDILGLCWNWN